MNSTHKRAKIHRAKMFRVFVSLENGGTDQSGGIICDDFVRALGFTPSEYMSVRASRQPFRGSKKVTLVGIIALIPGSDGDHKKRGQWYVTGTLRHTLVEKMRLASRRHRLGRALKKAVIYVQFKNHEQ